MTETRVLVAYNSRGDVLSLNGPNPEKGTHKEFTTAGELLTAVETLKSGHRYDFNQDKHTRNRIAYLDTPVNPTTTSRFGGARSTHPGRCHDS